MTQKEKAVGHLGLAKARLLKDDTVATENEVQLLHGRAESTGQIGLFTNLCSDRLVLNAVPYGYSMDLPAFPTTSTDPIFTALTSAGEEEGEEPLTPCEPGITPGEFEACMLRFRLGRKLISSKTLDLDEMFTKICAGDTRDYVLLGTFMHEQGPFNAGEIDRTRVLNIILDAERAKMANVFHRYFNLKKWTGDVSAPGQTPGYREFDGFDKLIKTGYVDSETGDPCPALDSCITDFGGDCMVNGGLGNDIFQALSEMEWALYDRVQRFGYTAFTAELAMTPNAWRTLSTIWPVLQQNSPALALPSGAQLVVDGRSVFDEAELLRNRSQIAINSRTYIVRIDDGIVRTAGLSPESSMYFIPLTVDGVPVTYWEYKDYRQLGNELSQLETGTVKYWTDNGRYLWTTDQRLFCFRMHAKIEARLIFRAPFLAGRIDNICTDLGACYLNPYAPDNEIEP